ncbi:MAG: TetR/AcrR family transcriptional regulator [Pseudomonadota bacterium]|nr:TetR/AcrR family transcriptional regulator [Pseudomonadota bacterium]
MSEVVEAQRVARPRLLGGKGLGETKGKILEAAFRRLARDGYAALSTREIGRDAGVNHALINYHYHTKDQLVIAVLDEANRQLLERQTAMYRAPGSFAEKWAAARRFYRSDLASGFVRMQAELWAASLSNPGLREKFLPRIAAWKQVVSEGVADAVSTLEASGVKLPAPFTPEVIATWISEFWVGMEFSDLLGDPAGRKRHQAALDAIQRLLEDLDAKAASAKKVASPAKRAGRR